MKDNQILEESKRMLADGRDYLDIASFLTEKGINGAMRQTIFDELDKIKQKNATNKVDISIGKLVIGIPMAIFGSSLLYAGQFSPRTVLILIAMVIVGGIISLIEISKVVNNIIRK